jgi:hypothetical protein
MRERDCTLDYWRQPSACIGMRQRGGKLCKYLFGGPSRGFRGQGGRGGVLAVSSLIALSLESCGAPSPDEKLQFSQAAGDCEPSRIVAPLDVAS